MNKVEHHILVGGLPLCGYLGCAAGRDIAAKSGVDQCGFESGAAAKRAAAKLRPFFCAPVRAAPGLCPTFDDEG